MHWLSDYDTSVYSTSSSPHSDTHLSPSPTTPDTAPKPAQHPQTAWPTQNTTSPAPQSPPSRQQACQNPQPPDNSPYSSSAVGPGRRARPPVFTVRRACLGGAGITGFCLFCVGRLRGGAGCCVCSLGAGGGFGIGIGWLWGGCLSTCGQQLHGNTLPISPPHSPCPSPFTCPISVQPPHNKTKPPSTSPPGTALSPSLAITMHWIVWRICGCGIGCGLCLTGRLAEGSVGLLGFLLAIAVVRICSFFCEVLLFLCYTLANQFQLSPLQPQPKMLHKLTTPLSRTLSQLKPQQNHYKTLGLSRTATPLQIKKKYYELAKLYHPDVCKDKDSNVKFNCITVAYQVLVDQGRKREYDGENPGHGERGRDRDREGEREDRESKYAGFASRYRSQKQKPSAHEQPDNPYTAYDEYFKNNRTYTKPKRGSDINLNLTLSLSESITGCKKEVTYTQLQLCEACSQVEKQQCYACGGKGSIFNRVRREKEACGDCGGKGYSNPCGVCSGTSYMKRDVVNSVYIAKNTHHKSILRIQGLGNHGYKSSNGDLYITVFVEDSSEFKIDGNNIHSEYQLDYLTAILGGNAQINTVYGLQEVKIEPGTQSGQQLRLFNLGLTSQYSKRKGDHIVKFKIKVPENLTDKQRQLLAELNL